ncbi:hypothetical protein COE67_18080 [Priestia megaterium]|nr:hypothetical protein COE67_18080 [Priestia megaterium]
MLLLVCMILFMKVTKVKSGNPKLSIFPDFYHFIVELHIIINRVIKIEPVIIFNLWICHLRNFFLIEFLVLNLRTGQQRRW